MSAEQSFNPCQAVGCDLCCRKNSVALNANEIQYFESPNVSFFDLSPLDNGSRPVAVFDNECPNNEHGECAIQDRKPFACKMFEFAGPECDKRRAQFGLEPVRSLNEMQESVQLVYNSGYVDGQQS